MMNTAEYLTELKKLLCQGFQKTDIFLRNSVRNVRTVTAPAKPDQIGYSVD